MFFFWFISALEVTHGAVFWQQSSLYRMPNSFVNYGNFKSELYQRLSVTTITSSSVQDTLDCTFNCIGDKRCSSFNMATNPDSSGFYLCELLATDKYRAKTKFHANATFRHYNPWVSLLFCCRYFFIFKYR